MRATGSRPRSFVRRYGSTSGSPSACATSRICSPSAPKKKAGLASDLEARSSRVDPRASETVKRRVGAAPSRLRSSCIIAAGGEVICAFGRFEEVGAGFERPHQAGDGSLGELAQMGLQLRKSLLPSRFSPFGYRSRPVCPVLFRTGGKMARPKRFELLTPRFVVWLSRSQDLRSNVQKRLAFPSKESMCVVSAAEWPCADGPSPRRPLDPGLASVTGQDWPGLVREKGRSMSIKLTRKWNRCARTPNRRRTRTGRSEHHDLRLPSNPSGRGLCVAVLTRAVAP